MSDNTNTTTETYVIFKVFENKFAVNCRFVTSIENTDDIYDTDDTNVFNMRKLLWGDKSCPENAKPMEQEHIIVLQVKDKDVGIIVDVAENIGYIDEIQELPASVVTGKYIKKAGLGKTDRQIIYILEPEAFE